VLFLLVQSRILPALSVRCCGCIVPAGRVFNESPGLPPHYTRILLILFLCTLALVNPIVHGDGVGYYAYVRAPLIEGNFDFPPDYQSGMAPDT